MANNPQRPPHVPPLSEFPPLSGSSPPNHQAPAFPPMPRGADGPSRGALFASARDSNRHSGEFRPHHANGSKAIPTGPHGGPHGPHGPAPFHGARSPPSRNTSHVPCKFYKQGQCQAGTACPFSHSLDASKFEQPCKYFSKGNCKFGQKCALLHVLPNGRVVNRAASGGMGALPLNIGNRVDPPLYQHQESALGNSLLSQQGNALNQPFGHQLPPHVPDVSPGLPPTMRPQPFDTPREGNVGTVNNLGSPNSFTSERRPSLRGGEEGRTQLHAGPGQSPVLPNTSLADVKLPASFDSNGRSYMAMFGPIASSVPTKMGLDSPPPSMPMKMAVPPSITANVNNNHNHNNLRTFHDTAFPSTHSPAGASSNLMVEAGRGDGGGTGPRPMHSQRNATRPRMVSTSLPRSLLPGGGDDHDYPVGNAIADEAGSDGGGAGEEYVPGVLSHLLNPEERQRRRSGQAENPIAIRGALAADARALHPPHASPGDGAGGPAARWGSPGAAPGASPSRFSGFWAKAEDGAAAPGTAPAAQLPVGSPFRASRLSPSLRPTAQRLSGGPADLPAPFGVSSPPRAATSVLSQQLSRMRLASDASSATGGASPGLHALHPPMVAPGGGGGGGGGGSASVNAHRIDEEREREQDFVFRLDEDEELALARSPWSHAAHPKSPLGSVGDGRYGASAPEPRRGPS